MPTSIAGE